MNSLLFLAAILFSSSSYAGGSDDNMIFMNLEQELIDQLTQPQDVLPGQWNNGSWKNILKGGSDDIFVNTPQGFSISAGIAFPGGSDDGAHIEWKGGHQQQQDVMNIFLDHKSQIIEQLIKGSQPPSANEIGLMAKPVSYSPAAKKELAIYSVQFVKEEDGYTFMKINNLSIVISIKTVDLANYPGLSEALFESRATLDWAEVAI